MYSLTVRSHILIAHSLPRDTFGPAAGLHGATYVIDAEFRRAELDSDNIVMDIGRATEILEEVASSLNYRNLDDDPRFAGSLTTTEFLAHFIHGEIADRLADAFRGELEVTLAESHVARASYRGPIG